MKEGNKKKVTVLYSVLIRLPPAGKIPTLLSYFLKCSFFHAHEEVWKEHGIVFRDG